MCGIFGFSYDNEKNTNYSPDFQEDISIFTNLSKIRGSDTFGLLISNINDNYIYKINTEPSAALKRNDYKSFIKNTIDFIKKNNDKKISVIGQTRLVTNGTKFLYANNQPITHQEPAPRTRSPTCRRRGTGRTCRSASSACRCAACARRRSISGPGSRSS